MNCRKVFQITALIFFSLFVFLLGACGFLNVSGVDEHGNSFTENETVALDPLSSSLSNDCSSSSNDGLVVGVDSIASDNIDPDIIVVSSSSNADGDQFDVENLIPVDSLVEDDVPSKDDSHNIAYELIFSNRSIRYKASDSCLDEGCVKVLVDEQTTKGELKFSVGDDMLEVTCTSSIEFAYTVKIDYEVVRKRFVTDSREDSIVFNDICDAEGGVSEFMNVDSLLLGTDVKNTTAFAVECRILLGGNSSIDTFYIDPDWKKFAGVVIGKCND